MPARSEAIETTSLGDPLQPPTHNSQPLTFEVRRSCPTTQARLGRMVTARGVVVETPVFMPVGTQGTVKAMTQQELWDMGYRLILGNTYHLHLRPGEALLQRAGGLHRFIGWDGAILTDSGGFQVFSLADLRKITEEGVAFKSYLDGSAHFFSPEGVIDIQWAIGADLIMAFDECTPYPTTLEEARRSMERTHRWETRCRDRWEELRSGVSGVGCRVPIGLPDTRHPASSASSRAASTRSCGRRARRRWRRSTCRGTRSAVCRWGSRCQRCGRWSPSPRRCCPRRSRAT
jgi:queuine tRNA-ribosyltransferase-like protein